MEIGDHPAFKDWNATVKCHLLKQSNYLTNGKIYSVKNGFLISDGGEEYNGEKVNGIEKLNEVCVPYATFELVTEPDLPRICYILGGEKTPLRIGERFEIKGCAGHNYQILDDNACACTGNADSNSLWYDIIVAINHPDRVIRRPQFSEDEKALMRLYVAHGRPIFKPDKNDYGKVVAWDYDGVRGNGLPKGILTQITKRFDAAAYLESEEAK